MCHVHGIWEVLSPELSRILQPGHGVLEDAEVTSFCSTSLKWTRLMGEPVLPSQPTLSQEAK